MGYLCQQVSITLTDLLQAFRHGMLSKAQIQTTLLVTEKIHLIVTDILDKAITAQVLCDTCKGSGQTAQRTPKGKKPPAEPPTEPCLVCHATGKITREADFERQRLALELGELIKQPKGGGMTFQQQINLHAGGDARNPQRTGTLEQLQQAVSKVLYAPNTVIDLEPEP